MSSIQTFCHNHIISWFSTQRRHLFSAAALFLAFLLAGCGKTGQRGIGAPNGAPETGTASVSQEPVSSEVPSGVQSGKLQSFQPDEVNVVPEIPFYPLDIAEEPGTVQKLRGVLPGASEGTWYTVSLDGIEYYYGIYDDQSDPLLYGYAVFDDSYSLTNGIKVGMAENEILSAYPNMAVMDFDGNFLQDKIGCAGWNPAAYPRSYLDMDASFNYGGADYLWSDQFDHLLIAEIKQGNPDDLPLYLALLMKDQNVAAITFYHPTAD